MLYVAEAQRMGNKRRSCTACLNPLTMCSGGKRAGSEELFHQFIVSLRDHLDEDFVRLVASLSRSDGMAASAALPPPPAIYRIRTHANQVDDSAESSSPIQSVAQQEPLSGRKTPGRLRRPD